MNAISRINEYSQEQELSPPVYKYEIVQSHPSMRFRCTASFADYMVIGDIKKSKKEAKLSAARKLMHFIDQGGMDKIETSKQEVSLRQSTSRTSYKRELSNEEIYNAETESSDDAPDIDDISLNYVLRKNNIKFLEVFCEPCIKNKIVQALDKIDCWEILREHLLLTNTLMKVIVRKENRILTFKATLNNKIYGCAYQAPEGSIKIRGGLIHLFYLMLDSIHRIEPDYEWQLALDDNFDANLLREMYTRRKDQKIFKLVYNDNYVVSIGSIDMNKPRSLMRHLAYERLAQKFSQR